MIYTALFNSFIVTIIIGYSYALKLVLFSDSSNQKIFNQDILYGLFFLICISLFLNFFFPLKYFFLPISIIGFFYFIYCFIKKDLKINLLLYFLIIFFLVFITYYHGENSDSPMYHLQAIKWKYQEKIIFGLPNLEIRFATNSLWFNLLSIFQFKLNNFNSIYTFNLIPLSFLFYEVFNKEKKLSNIFLFLSVSFIVFFSYLHPFRNGIILNHLRNPELDTVAMSFFIFNFYLFLKFLEHKKINDYYLLCICSIICIFIKVSYIGAIIFPLSTLMLYYKKNFIGLIQNQKKLFLLIFLAILFWFLKNFIISGCFIFPIISSCFEVSWSVGLNEIENYSKVVKGFARDTPQRLRYLDFEHTINSYNWFAPWFKQYAMNNAFLKIALLVSLISISYLFILNIFKNTQKIYFDDLKIILITFFNLVINFLIWFQAPEIRFGWGTIITICCFLLSVAILKNRLFYKLDVKFIQSAVLILFILLIYDNKKNLTFNNLITPKQMIFNYSKINKFYSSKGKDFYKSLDSKCYDFEEICVNTTKKEYNFMEKYGYLIFLKNI